MPRIGQHIRHNLWGIVAVFIALGGTAAALPGKNTVDSGDIRKGQVKGADIANRAVSRPKIAKNAVDGTKVAPNSLMGSDIDESSLALPPAPTTLPPSGPAGGDLSGQFPNPQVSEAGLAAGGALAGPLSNADVLENQLAAGGDLSGTVANAQVSEQALNAGGDLAGSTLSNAQIGAGTVGDAEIANGSRLVSISASEVGAAALSPANAPDVGVTAGGFPALLFDGSVAETVDLLLRAPSDIAPGAFLTIDILFSAPSVPATGTVRFDTAVAEVSANADELLSGASAFSTGTFVVTMDTAGELKEAGGGGGGGSNFLPGDLIRVEITRDPTQDTLAADAALHLVEATFTTTR